MDELQKTQPVTVETDGVDILTGSLLSKGTAAVVSGMLLAAVHAIGAELKDQTVVIYGAGSFGCGIGRSLIDLMVAEDPSDDEAQQRFYALDSDGLLLDDDDEVEDFKKPFARNREDIEKWTSFDGNSIDLIDVVGNVRPTVLLGASGQGGAFSEDVIRRMAEQVEHPIILALSNPQSNCEASPQDVMDWTNGKALVATGSPFDPVRVDGVDYGVDQINNAYIFPGVGLGVLAVEASRVSDAMFVAAARALAGAGEGDAEGPGRLLSPVDDLRGVSLLVARAVARQARDEGLCESFDDDALETMIGDCVWSPQYRPYTPECARERRASARQEK